MTGNSSAQRQAKRAAAQAENTRLELQQQTALERERINREKIRAQRLMMRSLRAGSGGFFETDTTAANPLGTTTLLGGTGVLG